MDLEMLDAPSPTRLAGLRASAVIELRCYTALPGHRDALVALFEREFLAPQEACGIELIGHFRDLDDPDRFVSLCGYRSMPARAEALAAFCSGPAWRRHHEAANATMREVDDVRLLRPCRPRGGFALPPRADADAETAAGLVLVHLHPLRALGASDFAAAFERHWVPMLWDQDIALAATLVNEHRGDPFPALPGGADTPVFAWVTRHPDPGHAQRAQDRIARARRLQPALDAALALHQAGPARVLRLQPTPRSRLRG